MKVKNVSSLELFQHHSQRQERDLVLDWFWYILLKHLLALSTDFWLPFYISPFFLPFHYIRHFSLQIKSEARDKWRTSNKTCNLEILPSQVTYTHMVCVCPHSVLCETFWQEVLWWFHTACHNTQSPLKSWRSLTPTCCCLGLYRVWWLRFSSKDTRCDMTLVVPVCVWCVCLAELA